MRIAAADYEYVRLSYLPKLREAIQVLFFTHAKHRQQSRFLTLRYPSVSVCAMQSLSAMVMREDVGSLRNEVFRIRNTTQRFGLTRVTDICQRLDAVLAAHAGAPEMDQVMECVDDMQNAMRMLRIVSEEGEEIGGIAGGEVGAADHTAATTSTTTTTTD